MGRVGDYVDSSRQATVSPPHKKLFSTTTAEEESKCSHFLLKQGTPGCLVKDSFKSPGGSSWLTNAHIKDFLLPLYTGMATVLTRQELVSSRWVHLEQHIPLSLST